MGLADFARQFEQEYNRRGIVRRRRQGWLPLIQPYMGYGSTSSLRVLGRALMADPNEEAARFLPEQAQRGWRQFFTTQVGFLPVTVTIGTRTIATRSDESGYIDVIVEDHGLPPGQHSALITPAAGAPVSAPVTVVDPRARVGLISDVDDTIMVTWLPRPLTAAWNSFVLRTNSRMPVPGIAEFYDALLAGHETAPVFYLSTGAWNTAGTLEGFIRANGLPPGPLLLTDWGPTPTGLFRSGQEHKKTQLRNLIIAFPHIRWFLVGDDGQHDPLIYADLAREHPSHVSLIALRQLNPVEQVLSHGTPGALDGRQGTPTRGHISTPVIYGRDGHELLESLRALG
ncbi:MAG: DUF2183 domain-containing protein [Actinomycetaceae bacterium]|nr:DUF2183 domain-containing protein [Actinomycetaceae bacterium]